MTAAGHGDRWQAAAGRLLRWKATSFPKIWLIEAPLAGAAPLAALLAMGQPGSAAYAGVSALLTHGAFRTYRLGRARNAQPVAEWTAARFPD